MDTNVFVYAFRKDADRHQEYSDWLESALATERSFGFSDLVLSAFVRISTHPRIFVQPSRTQEALAFANAIRNSPNAIRISPQSGHWEIFSNLCLDAGAKANLVTDAYWAALALEAGCTWITCDRDFARFRGLKWRHPLDSA